LTEFFEKWLSGEGNSQWDERMLSNYFDSLFMRFLSFRLLAIP